MKRKVIIGITLIVIMFLSSNIMPLVNAFDGSVDIGYTNYESLIGNMYSPVDSLYAVHSATDQIVYASTVGGTYGDRLRIHIVGSDGSINADFDLDYSGDAYQTVSGIGVFDMDDDYVLVHYQTVYVSSYDGLYSRVLKINMNSLAYTVYTSAYYSYRSNSGDHFNHGSICSEVMTYDSTNNAYYFYLSTIISTSGTTSNMLYVIEYDDDTNSVVVGDADGRGNNVVADLGTPYPVQLSDDDYGIFSFEDSTHSVVFLTYDGSTDTITYQMAFATSALWEGSSNNRKMDYIDGGIEYEIVGSDIHYYVYLVYTVGDNLGSYSPWLDIRYLRLKFNNTLTSGDLLSQSVKTIGYAPYSDPLDSGDPWSIGLLDVDLEELTIWYNKYYPLGSPYQSELGKLTCELSNFTDMTTATFSVLSDVSDYDTDIYPTDSDYPTARDLTGGYQVTLIPSSESILIYYGGEYVTDDFTFDTGYVPVDVPLIQNTNYYFYADVDNYGTGYEGAIVLFYVDGTLLSSKLTNTAGECEFTVRFTSVGNHTVTIEIYKDISTMIYDITTAYIVVSQPETTEEEETAIFGDSLFEVATNIIPLAICILLPAHYGGQRGGLMGYGLGGIVGVAIAVGSGYLPIYYVYLIALIIVMGFIFVIRSGGGKPE